MSANSAVQHLASGLGALIGGKIIITAADRSLERFGWVGIMADDGDAALALAGRPGPFGLKKKLQGSLNRV